MSELANPETGAMGVDDAVASLIAPSEEDNAPEAEAEAPQEAQAEEAPEVEAEAEQAEAETEEADAEPEESEPEEEPETYVVKVDGEEVRVSLEEALSGYQRDADYRRKTQAVSEDRRALEQERAEIGSLKERLAEALETQARQQDQEPDWAKLVDELDPWEFNKQRVAWDQAQARRAQAAQHAARLREEQVKEITSRELDALFEAVPEWRSTEARQKGRAELHEAGKAYKFSPAEVDGILDHRLLVALRDAGKYRELQAQKPAVEKKVRKAPKAAKPGATRTAAQNRASQNEALRENLRKHGTVDDAVAFLMGGS